MSGLFREFAPASAADWVHIAQKTVAAERLVTQLHDGITLQAIYHDGPTPSAPGQFPFTRSTHTAPRPWWVAQSLPYRDAATFNAALLADLSAGQDAVRLDLCTATRAGLDAHHAPPALRADGTIINDLDDLSAALKDVNLSAVPLLVDTGASALPFGGLLRAHFAASAGADLAALQGYVAADPLGHGVKTGLLPATLPILEDQLALWSRWHLKNAPKLRTVLCDGTTYREAGATLVQELGFVLATALHYLRALTLRGLSIDEAAGTIQFRVVVGGHLFSEIARLRAARQLWARLVAHCGGDSESQKMAIHAVTARFNKSRLDRHTNLLRTTTEAFAAAIGGADALTVGTFDCLDGPPDDFSRRLARNTHAILAEEAQLARLVDPLGGAWYGEQLTEEIAAAAWREVQAIEAQGGMGRALLKGTVQSEVSEKSRAALLQIFSGKQGLVGVNRYPNAADALLPLPAPAATPHLDRLKMSRDGAVLNAALDLLTVSNTVKNLSVASGLGATVGELTAALSQGRGAAWTTLKPMRWAAAFESLRQQATAYGMAHGQPPTVQLIAVGKLAHLKLRIDFAANVLKVGGFAVPETVVDDGAAAVATLSALAERPLAVLLCAADGDYPELLSRLAPAVATTWLVAGPPQANVALAASHFVHAKANLLNLLDELHRALDLAP